jgi:HAMP domain-containing protein
MSERDSFRSHINSLAKDLRRREREEQLKRLAQEDAQGDFSGVPPDQVFNIIGARDCKDFLRLMAAADFPEAELIGQTETADAAAKPAWKGLLGIIVGYEPAPKPAEEPSLRWRAYKIGRAARYGEEREVQDAEDIFLCEDGNIRTFSGLGIEPEYTVEIGYVTLGYRSTLQSSSNGSSGYDHMYGAFKRTGIREQLTRIAAWTGMIDPLI